MNKQESLACVRLRDRMAEWALEGRSQAQLPEEWKAHLDRCASCALYAEGLDGLSLAPKTEPLYTPALRRATLMALDARESAPARWPLLFVPAALVFNLFLSVALPAGLFHEILPAALGRTLIGGFLSVLAAACVGTATALVCSISMKTTALKEVRHA